jgi:hypothetical protein
MKVAGSLQRIIDGDDFVQLTPLAKSLDIDDFISGWTAIMIQNVHKMNDPLIELESNSKIKIGPRSRQLPWVDREEGIHAYWTSQDDKHLIQMHRFEGPGYLIPLSMKQASKRVKLNSSAGIPFAMKKRDCIKFVMENHEEYMQRKDPCALFTRTGENWKTRPLWGYPFADVLFEMMFYVPLMLHQRTLSWRSNLISPDAVARQVTKIIDWASLTGRILYSIDFAGFDASVKWQYIHRAFEYFASCYHITFHDIIIDIAVRFYTIGLVTPKGVMNKGNHAIASGGSFTNECGSVVQAGIALICKFIHLSYIIVQGDDGLYAMYKDEILEFEAAFAYAGLKIEKSKSLIADNHAIFCQELYHSDYRDEDEICRGIYPTYRAVARLLFPERFTDFKSAGIECKDFYTLRGISILENCKYHPLHEELVRYVLSKEKFSLNFSEEGLKAYIALLNKGSEVTAPDTNYQHGSNVAGINGWKTMHVIRQILAEEQSCTPTD